MEEVEEKRIELLGDVMIDILKRLPAKSLIRLKCVSKSWYSLINNPDFIFIHYNYDPLSNQFIFLKRYLEIEESTEYSIYYNGKNMLSFHSNDESFKPVAENIEYMDDYIGVNVAGVCNGILCICSYRGIVLYNPTLREFWKLPPSILPLLADLSPSKKINCWMDLATGIGFDTNTNDYKVVRILDPSNEYEFEGDNRRKFISKVEIYNLSTNCWRKLDDLECIIGSFHYSRVLFNKAYYWRGCLSVGYNCIVSFDFSTESFQKLAYPEDLDGDRSESLSVLNQNLALIYYTEFYSPDMLVEQSIDIWIMKKYGVRESWVKEFTVGPMLIRKPLSVWKNGTELMIESKEGKLVSYNFFFQSTKELHMSGVQNTLEAFVCKESLISIKKERGK